MEAMPLLHFRTVADPPEKAVDNRSFRYRPPGYIPASGGRLCLSIDRRCRLESFRNVPRGLLPQSFVPIGTRAQFLSVLAAYPFSLNSRPRFQARFSASDVRCPEKRRFRCLPLSSASSLSRLPGSTMAYSLVAAEHRRDRKSVV